MFKCYLYFLFCELSVHKRPVFSEFRDLDIVAKFNLLQHILQNIMHCKYFLIRFAIYIFILFKVIIFFPSRSLIYSSWFLKCLLVFCVLLRKTFVTYVKVLFSFSHLFIYLLTFCCAHTSCGVSVSPPEIEPRPRQ